MSIRYDVMKLEQMLRDFHNLTGICVCILDRDFHKLVAFPKETNRFCVLIQSSPEGFQRCRASDLSLLRACAERRETVTHRCHAGLTDMVVPILQNELLLGFILFGQLCETEDRKPSFEQIHRNLRDLPADPHALSEAYDGLIFYDQERIRSAAALVEMLTKYIWMEQVMEPILNDRFEEIPAYIESHLNETITVPLLCERFHLSKNTLYSYFKTYTQSTVKEYVCHRRILRAEQLLLSTDLPVWEISEQVGIDNTHYFCRIFKQKTGLSPLQYRKSHSGYNH